MHSTTTSPSNNTTRTMTTSTIIPSTDTTVAPMSVRPPVIDDNSKSDDDDIMSSALMMLQQQLRRQVEFYFSESNLSRDTYLQSLLLQKRDDQYPPTGMVPVSIIANFPRIRDIYHNSSYAINKDKKGHNHRITTTTEEITGNPTLDNHNNARQQQQQSVDLMVLANSLRNSPVVQVSDDGLYLRPIHQHHNPSVIHHPTYWNQQQPHQQPTATVLPPPSVLHGPVPMYYYYHNNNNHQNHPMGFVATTTSSSSMDEHEQHGAVMKGGDGGGLLLQSSSSHSISAGTKVTVTTTSSSSSTTSPSVSPTSFDQSISGGGGGGGELFVSSPTQGKHQQTGPVTVVWVQNVMHVDETQVRDAFTTDNVHPMQIHVDPSNHCWRIMLESHEHATTILQTIIQQNRHIGNRPIHATILLPSQPQPQVSFSSPQAPPPPPHGRPIPTTVTSEPLLPQQQHDLSETITPLRSNTTTTGSSDNVVQQYQQTSEHHYGVPPTMAPLIGTFVPDTNNYYSYDDYSHNADHDPYNINYYHDQPHNHHFVNQQRQHYGSDYDQHILHESAMSQQHQHQQGYVAGNVVVEGGGGEWHHQQYYWMVPPHGATTTMGYVAVLPAPSDVSEFTMPTPLQYLPVQTHFLDPGQGTTSGGQFDSIASSGGSQTTHSSDAGSSSAADVGDARYYRTSNNRGGNGSPRRSHARKGGGQKKSNRARTQAYRNNNNNNNLDCSIDSRSSSLVLSEKASVTSHHQEARKDNASDGQDSVDGNSLPSQAYLKPSTQPVDTKGTKTASKPHSYLPKKKGPQVAQQQEMSRLPKNKAAQYQKNQGGQQLSQQPPRANHKSTKSTSTLLSEDQFPTLVKQRPPTTPQPPPGTESLTPSMKDPTNRKAPPPLAYAMALRNESSPHNHKTNNNKKKFPNMTSEVNSGGDATPGTDQGVIKDCDPHAGDILMTSSIERLSVAE